MAADTWNEIRIGSIPVGQRMVMGALTGTGLHSVCWRRRIHAAKTEAYDSVPARLVSTAAASESIGGVSVSEGHVGQWSSLSVRSMAHSRTWCGWLFS